MQPSSCVPTCAQTKWNNNAGAVLKTSSPTVPKRGGFELGILEEDEDEDEDERCLPIEVDDVPQAFSHFTFEASGGKQLVCDLQGTWNPDDGFTLTDPVVHYISSKDPASKHKNGATDKGREGIRKFFMTHQCNGLCERLGLQTPDLSAPGRMK